MCFRSSEQRVIRVNVNAHVAFSVTVATTEEVTFDRESHAPLATIVNGVSVRDVDDTHQALVANNWHILLKYAP
jgi:hypothetical protein